jgi:hypothetical protein
MIGTLERRTSGALDITGHNDRKERQVVAQIKNIQFNSGQPEDYDNIQWRALEIMSVQLGRSATPQILNSSQRSCQKANARPYR